MKIVYSKTQISIFVIVSAILVIGAIFVISLNSDSIAIFSDQKSSYKVKEYVQSCMDLETTKAIDLIGAHGGWLYHKDMTFTDRSKPDLWNKNAKGLDFLEQVKMPYWYYYDDSSEEFVLNIPHYDSENQYSLKNQVKRYVEENLENDCLRGFVDFEDVYEIRYEPKEIRDKIVVDFDEDKLIVTLDLPLEIREKNSDNVEYVDFFKIKKDNKLWIPYHLALDITVAEASSSFVEYRILNFLNPYQRADTKDLLPPFYDYRMTYDFEPWSIPEVVKLAKNIVSSNLRQVQFLNTDYNEYKLTPQQQKSDFAKGFSEIYVKDYLSESSITKKETPKLFRKYRDYKVKPTYEIFYPTYFNIQPSMGNMILLPRPEAVINLIPFFFTEYVSVYEITMPITFEIKSNQPNDDFIFNFAIEANIDHNTPLTENRIVNYDFGDLVNNPKSLVCDPVHFISNEVSINITDSVNYGKRKLADPLIGVEDAIVQFNCKGISECYIGQTQINGKYISKNITELTFRLPINCNPGTLEIYKYGHKKVTIENLDPNLESNINLGTVDMPSQKTMNLKVKLVGYGSSKFSTGSTFGEYDSGFLIFTSLEDSDMVSVVEVNRYNEDNLTIDLTSGKYKIEGFVIYNNSINIPKEEICYSSGGVMGFGGSDECTTIPAMTLDSWVRGGIELKDFDVPLNKLLERDTITVNFVDFGLPNSYTTLADMSDSMGNLDGVSQTPYFD